MRRHRGRGSRTHARTHQHASARVHCVASGRGHSQQPRDFSNPCKTSKPSNVNVSPWLYDSQKRLADVATRCRISEPCGLDYYRTRYAMPASFLLLFDDMFSWSLCFSSEVFSRVRSMECSNQGFCDVYLVLVSLQFTIINNTSTAMIIIIFTHIIYVVYMKNITHSLIMRFQKHWFR